ncbi:MAG: membrane protein insertase YidC [Pseudomonadota bacterium]|nr:membrane protein insertase YidC [Pseudomonadota bacterium]
MSQPQTPKIDPKNMITAVVISMAIVFGWQYFYLTPNAKKAEEQAAQIAKVQAAAPTVESTIKDLNATLSATKRVKIDTPTLSGSINLTGAQFDDLRLVKYHETIDDTSPEVTLLRPSGTANGYFIEQGFSVPTGQTLKLPDKTTEWQAADGASLQLDKPVTLTWDNGEGLKFSRTISLTDDYLFTVHDAIANGGSAAVNLFPFARVQRQDLPEIGTYTFFQGAHGVQNRGLEEHDYKSLKKTPGTPVEIDNTGGWLGFTDKYWATALIPPTDLKVKSSYQNVANPVRDVFQADYLAQTPVSVPAGGSAVFEDHIYAGAKVVNTINAIGAKYALERFDLMIDWGWYSPLTKSMFYLLSFVKGIVGNYGVAILIVTVLVKLAVFPLASRSYASMSKMKNLKPQMDALKLQYPDDKQKQQQAMMELYKTNKVNPMAGCLPVVVQIPVFFSLYKVILTTIDLRHSPFVGWIQDLSAPDPTSLFNLFGLISWHPPAMLMIGFWPLLMGVTMWVQMRLNPTPPDPVQAQMFNWMPVIFTYSMSGFPAGLTIYWAWSNFLSIIQQSYIMTKNGTEVEFFKYLPFLKKKPT